METGLSVVNHNKCSHLIPIFFFLSQLFYSVSVCLCVVVIVAFQLSAFTFRENLAATALLLALFGYVMRNTAAELWFVFWKRKSPGITLNLLSASWFSLVASNYVASARQAEQTSPSRPRSVEGKQSHGRNEGSMDPDSERFPSWLTKCIWNGLSLSI